MVISYSEPTTTVRKAVTYTSTPPVDAVVGGSYGGTANGGASANPVVFTIDTTSTTGACSVAGVIVSFTGAGTCVLNAEQAGDAAYSAAETAQQSFTVGKATITAVV